jgi:carnitine O-acetyltransferase
MNNSKLKNKRTIPNLKETYKNYIDFIKPYSSQKKDQEESDNNFKEFMKKQGQSLQKRLQDKNNLITNWYYDQTLETNLKAHDGLNNNSIMFDFGFVDQIDAVSKIILSTLRLKKEMLSDKTKNNILNELYIMFHSCRLPVLNERDKLLHFDLHDNKYFIILYKNIFWLLEAPGDYEALCDMISYITIMDLAGDRNGFVGILAIDNRNAWAQKRVTFTKYSTRNFEFMYYLERCILLFCLEEKTMGMYKSNEELVRHCWFGEGENRFSDKILQVVVLRDGYTCFNCDKVCDMNVVIEFAKYVQNIQNEIVKEKPMGSYFENYPVKPIKLNYDLGGISTKEIYEEFGAYISEIHFEMLLFTDFGKVAIQRKGLTINGFIQLALLAAYYRMTLAIVPSRQYVNCRFFQNGSMEFLRTTTKETANFCVALNEMKVPRDLKLRLGYDAFKAYNNNLEDIKQGKSVDVHLTGLNTVLKEGEKVKVFEDKMFLDSVKWKIETYPFQNDFILNASVLPQFRDCISVCFIVRKDQIQFNFIYYKDDLKLDLTEYMSVLQNVLKEMKDLFIEKKREVFRPKF